MGPSEFIVENDFIHRETLGDLKAMMVSNKMDYEEQVKREEDQKKQAEEIKKAQIGGVVEIGESGDEENNGKTNSKKAGLKRERVEDDEEIEIFDNKPSKHIKIA